MSTPVHGDNRQAGFHAIGGTPHGPKGARGVCIGSASREHCGLFDADRHVANVRKNRPGLVHGPNEDQESLWANASAGGMRGALAPVCAKEEVARCCSANYAIYMRCEGLKTGTRGFGEPGEAPGHPQRSTCRCNDVWESMCFS